MTVWSHARCDEIEKEFLCGFILKSKSPSCGLNRVKLINKDNIIVRTGTGIFARIFQERFPFIPVTDEISLSVPTTRKAFIKQAIDYYHLNS